MKQNMKLITGAILAVGLVFAPNFLENHNKTELIYEWERLNTSISSTTWELGEPIETEDETGKEVEETILKTVVINQSGNFKSYMPYRAVTNTSSKQYKVRQLAYTSDFGLRKIGERYCVAVGTAVTSNTGTFIDVILKNGIVIPCVVGDIKSNADTNSDNITTSDNGCVCEFLTDTELLPNYIKRITGNVSHCYDEWMSPVEKIIVYERSVFDE